MARSTGNEFNPYMPIPTTVPADSTFERLRTIDDTFIVQPNIWEAGAVLSFTGVDTSKTAYQQAIAALTRRCTHLYLYFNGVSGADAILDIAVGAAASEVIKIPDIRNLVNNALGLIIPVEFAAGARVAIRAAVSTGSGATVPVRTLFGGRS